ncbi:GMC oxidoreductase [Kriegella aquimaris]|uniref:Choline dehydrogenase n=1 Tax=Kriegella aquimaris TaxID=192904 RepID=A0A1G9S978_9FLAO|nr:GMC family oxidoreductase [Kriegella aquimaris]SDM32014.1 Choline dehydrogenase [Kriegella aquimaris]
MEQELKTDYCIVGGGIAGILLASRLVATGKKILILDQGPRFTEEDRANMLRKSREDLNDFADYNDNVDPNVVTPLSSAKSGDLVVEWTNYRLFGIGGTALHFEGLMMRPTEEDMQVKTRYGYSRDWPIPYPELEPWLLEAEYEIGVSGNDDNPYTSSRSGSYPMPGHSFSYFDSEIFAPALNKTGITGHSCPRAVNSVRYRGRSACLACRACKFCPTGARYSPDRVHVPILEKYDNVKILENISVRKLETNSKGDKIVAAHAVRLQDKSEVVVLAKNFIVAMGGVETPRMLLLSADKGIHKNGLGNMGGQLGAGFNDHDNLYVTFDAGRPVGRRLGYETMVSDHFRKHTNRVEQPTFTMYASPAMDWFPIGNEATIWSRHGNIVSLENLRESLPNMATLSIMTESEGKGILELDKEKLDAFGDPLAKVTMKLTEWDRKSYTKFVELAPQLAEAMSANKVSDVTPPGFGLGYHPSGATAMAKKPDEGVCDENLKVFGLNNLHLVSNSVFPHMGSNPPTLTIAALALRLAAHLQQKK